MTTLARRMWDWLRAIFVPQRRPRFEDTDEVFRPIDVERVKADLNLSRDAERFGESELPRPHDTSPDGPHVRIRQYINDKIADAYRRANRELEKSAQALRARSVEALVERAEGMPKETAALVRQQMAETESRIQQQKRQLKRARKRIAKYQDKHGMDRDPDLREDYERRVIIIVTIAVAALQGLANAALFAQGMRFGLSGGLALAVVLGFADVALHHAGGRVAARSVAPDLFNRSLGVFISLFLMATVSTYNLGLVHLRTGIRERGMAQGFEQWLPSLVNDPLGFTDFGSFALLVIGLVCSTLAVISGWQWDEPIPLFRRMGTKAADAREELEFWQIRADNLRTDRVKEAQEELDEIWKQVDHNVQACEALWGRIKRIHENLETFLSDAANAFATLIRFYRDENRLARSTEEPPYFDQEPAIAIKKPLELDLDDIEEYAERQRAIRDRFRDDLPALKSRVSNLTLSDNQSESR